ncbi:malate synthase G [Microbacterium testaceum]|uniref:malate synthase G n=1 Tax=Microbacterium testaceum TaxID=2033 RepID=UPI001D171B64|nr:malate synthase G [Microbacterium testaceum]MCC4248293.1 malate synthase G [Microbacterium testaceum]
MNDFSGALAFEPALRAFLLDEALPSAGIPAARFDEGLAAIIADLEPRRRALLAERRRLEAEIDEWHRTHPYDAEAYRSHLADIGYLRPEPPQVVPVTTAGVAEELRCAGPQLVVPVTNRRYALNAVNARWGSLYDALYGTDALRPAGPPAPWDRGRAAVVVAAVRELLDDVLPLAVGSHARARAYSVHGAELQVQLDDGTLTALRDPESFRGYRGDPRDPSLILLRRHDLHLELHIDRNGRLGGSDPAGVDDVRLESALSTIVDFEDSVAVVDGDDKADAYRVWLGLNRGDLRTTFVKDGRVVERALADDRTYRAPDGGVLVLPGRSHMLVRSVGIHMATDMVRADEAAIGESFLDVLITALCAVPRLRAAAAGGAAEPTGLTVVMPKLHGPDEVAFVVDLLARVERVLDLPERTLLLGLMDEERRTSANLPACIAAASSRIAFVNTGFLDRSGDEIHTSFEAGPVVRKTDLRSSTWMSAYERRNVAAALAAGMDRRAQIGKGMWAMPDRMNRMLAEKAAHPGSGATTAWVPSPTAATLHALHYLLIDPFAVHADLAGAGSPGLEELLSLALAPADAWTEDEIERELETNLQSILGYVVRWVDQGVGCSTVADLDGVGLMEDRATLRISSQHVANWLRHGVVDEDRVHEAMARMAALVDEQNAHDPGYRPMSPDLSGPAFRAAVELVATGATEPNGYTERVLHRHRREAKAAAATRGAHAGAAR